MAKVTGRPALEYFIFNLPSDHEIDGSLTSESDVIVSILKNNGIGSKVKHSTCSTKESFNRLKNYNYDKVKYVHLGGHGSDEGIGFIGDTLSWEEVGSKLKNLFPKLNKSAKRELCLSCCYSAYGAEILSNILKGHFTRIYHFEVEEVNFSTAMTVWSMFYLKKRKNIEVDVNTFMKKNILISLHI